MQRQVKASPFIRRKGNQGKVCMAWGWRGPEGGGCGVIFVAISPHLRIIVSLIFREWKEGGRDIHVRETR